MGTFLESIAVYTPVPFTRSSSQSVVFLAAAVPWWTLSSFAFATRSALVGPAPSESSGPAPLPLPLPLPVPSSGAVSFFLPGIGIFSAICWFASGQSSDQLGGGKTVGRGGYRYSQMPPVNAPGSRGLTALSWLVTE